MKNKISSHVKILILMLIFIGSNYFVYGVFASNAYSGYGKELLIVRGNIIYFAFNHYDEGNIPETSFTISTPSINDAMGKRLTAEFNFFDYPSVLNKIGFFCLRDKKNHLYGDLTIVSVPLWFVFLLLTICYFIYKEVTGKYMPKNNE